MKLLRKSFQLSRYGSSSLETSLDFVHMHNHQVIPMRWFPKICVKKFFGTDRNNIRAITITSIHSLYTSAWKEDMHMPDLQIQTDEVPQKWTDITYHNSYNIYKIVNWKVWKSNRSQLCWL